MKEYVIKGNEGEYWKGGFYGSNNFGTITQAKIYQNEKNAKSSMEKIKRLYGLKVKLVQVEIKEIKEINI